MSLTVAAAFLIEEGRTDGASDAGTLLDSKGNVIGNWSLGLTDAE